MTQPVLYICHGSDCRDHQKSVRALTDEVDGVARVETVRCQKICQGMVVGFEIDGTLEWFRRAQKPKCRAAVVDALGGGRLHPPLSKRRVAKRSGKLR